MHSQPPFIITHRPFLSTTRDPSIASCFGRFILVLTVNTKEIPCIFLDRKIAYEDNENPQRYPHQIARVSSEKEVLLLCNTSILITRIEEVEGNILLYGIVLKPDLYSRPNVPNHEVDVPNESPERIQYTGGRSFIRFSTVLTGLLVLCAAALAPTLM